MKLVAERDINYSRGIKQSGNYSISANPKMFDMLSKMLYQDPIKACIQELSVNAFDATILADNYENMPIITLPTNDNSIFSIRDFGVSLSPDEVYQLYTIYGLSNKDDSNDLTGCFGLGSKTPFALSNSFTVTAYYNSKAYTYINDKRGKNGIPTCKLLHESPTNEPNGLQVSFSVKPDDIPKFHIKTAEVLQYFPKPFKVIDESNKYRPIENKVLFEGKRWKIFKNGRYFGNPKAVMGYIGYPIEISHISQSYTDTYRKILSNDIHIDFDIGEIEMDISREALQYNNKTITTIRNRLDEVKDDIVKQIEKDISNCKSKWDAAIKLQQVPHMLRDFVDDVTYKGENIETQSYVPNTIKCAKIPKDGILEYRWPYVTPYDSYVVYINDIKGPYTDNLSQYVISNNKPGYVLRAEDTEEIDKFIKTIGIQSEKIIYISSIKPAKTKVTKPKNKYVRKIRRFKGIGYYNSPSYDWIEEEVDLDKGGYYIQINNYKVVIDDKREHTHVLRDIIDAIPELKKKTIYGMTIPDIKKLNKKKWTNVVDLLKKEQKSWADKIGISKAYLCLSWNSRHEKLLDYEKNIKDPAVKKVLQKIKEVHPKLKEYNKLCLINSRLPKSLRIEPTNYTFAEEWDKILEKYILLSRVCNDFRWEKMDDDIYRHIVVYLNQVYSKGV